MTTPRLLALQEADTSIDRLHARRRALEQGAELAAVRSKADAAEARLGELRLQLDEIGRDQTRFEHEIDSMTQKEQAEQTRMYDGSIVNSKELEALQHEIASVRKRRSDREDELLALMELREQLEGDAAAAERETTTLRAKRRRPRAPQTRSGPASMRNSPSARPGATRSLLRSSPTCSSSTRTCGG